METLRHCLACGRDMTLEEWYPEMLCDPCMQDITMAFTGENEQEGLEYSNECH